MDAERTIGEPAAPSSGRQQIVRQPNEKPLGNFALRGAEDFDIRESDPIRRQPGIDCAEGEVRRVTIAREMTQDRPAQAVLDQARENLGGGGIREMAVARHDPLLDGPGTAAVRLKEFLVVIGFDNDGPGIAKPLVDQLGGESKISAEPEAGAPMMQDEANRIGGIMRYRKSLDRYVGHLELRAGQEKPGNSC